VTGTYLVRNEVPENAPAFVGDLGMGVVALEDARGSGFILFAEETDGRFSNMPSLNADKLITVVYSEANQQWYYDYNTGRAVFTPKETDVLVAALDFTHDKVQSLEGFNAVYGGIALGYASGDLAFKANHWNGAYNLGEFGVTGSHIVRNETPDADGGLPAFVGDLGMGVVALESATGDGYMMFAQDTDGRFAGVNHLSAKQLFTVVYNESNDTWYYDTNNELKAFTPEDTDVLVASIDFTKDTIESLEGQDDEYQGIALGYESGDLSFTANHWNGEYNLGEFGVDGTYIVYNDNYLIG